MKPTAPCLGCKERHGGCWTNCEKYLHFKTDNESHKAKIMQQKMKASLLDDYRIKSVIRQSGGKERER